MPQWVDECVASVKPRLRQRHPDWSEQELESSARAICWEQYNKKEKENAEVSFIEADCHAIAGDDKSNYALSKGDNKSDWALPYKGPDGVSKACVRNALARWNQVEGYSEEEKKKALRKLIRAAQQAGVDVSDEMKRKAGMNSESSDIDLTEKVFFYQSKMRSFDTLKEAVSSLQGDEIFPDSTGRRLLENLNSESEDALSYKLVEGDVVSRNVQKNSDTHFFITGEAIHTGTTRNLNTYLPSELKQAAPSLAGKAIQLDHSTKATENVGKVIASSYDAANKTVNYLGRIRKEHPVANAVKVGDIDTVSIGAYADDVVCSICGESKIPDNTGRVSCRHRIGKTYEGDTATAVGRGIHFVELSITPIPADPRASASHVTHDSYEGAINALVESFEQYQDRDDVKNMSEENKSSVTEEQLRELKEQNEKLRESLSQADRRARESLADRITELELRTGALSKNSVSERMSELVEKPIEALELLESSLKKQAQNMAAKENFSKGIVTEDNSSRSSNEITLSDAKELLRREILGFDEPTESARRTVAKLASSPDYPLARERRKLIFGDGR